MLIEVLVAGSIVMLASLVGIVFIQKTAQGFLEKNLSYLVSFSAGVFLITAGGFALEVFELTSTIWVGTAIIFLGYLLATSLNWFLPETHHHHDNECHSSHQAARKLIIGDSIHNVADGIVLVVAFAAGPALGMAATASVVIHEVLQEISEFFVLRQAGYSVRKALLINFAVSATILIGIILGYSVLVSTKLEALLLALSAGFLFHVVIHDLLPKPSDHPDQSKFFAHVLLLVLGIIIMGAIANALGEAHTHDGQQEGHEHEDHHELEHQQVFE